MKKINKQPPYDKFEAFVSKKNPNRWEQLPHTISQDSRLYILCNEQDCLCGYSEIPLDEKSTSSHIDHYYKRDLFPKKIYDWNNLIVSTIDEDFGGKYKDNTYKIKEEEYMQIFNPVDDDMSKFIEFSGNGEIVPLRGDDTFKVKKTIEVFNLNSISLMNRRRNLISQLNDCKDLPKEDIKKAFETCGFASVIEWFLNTL